MHVLLSKQVMADKKKTLPKVSISVLKKNPKSLEL